MSQTRKSSKKKSHFNSKLGCIITIIVLIPILYGVYLYSQQIHIGKMTTKTQEIVSSYQTFQIADLEIPQLLASRQEQIIKHKGYSVSYNKIWKLPNWVSYELTSQETQGSAKRENRFIADPLVEGAIATNGDYSHSGFDKGHMAPAADMKWNSTVMKESFYFSNMCPQHPQLNRRRWKDLEDKIRNWAVADSAIIIICGPIVDHSPKTIGRNHVVIPEKFFKVVLSPYTRPMRSIGFLFKNEQAIEPLSTYVVTVDSIESLIGMDFFASLPDQIESTVEANADLRQWPD